jgi:uncharacterized integral membrane protein
MREFWKRPKFWIGVIVFLWLVYLFDANLNQPVELFVVPLFLHRTLPVAAVILAAGMLGCFLTLLIQFSWRRRSSKKTLSSAAPPPSSSKTVA